MKSQTKEKSVPKKEITFPVLLREKKCGLVVLFENRYIGTVVNLGETAVHFIGQMRRDFTFCNSPSDWEEFTGEIILSNT